MLILQVPGANATDSAHCSRYFCGTPNSNNWVRAVGPISVGNASRGHQHCHRVRRLRGSETTLIRQLVRVDCLNHCRDGRPTALPRSPIVQCDSSSLRPPPTLHPRRAFLAGGNRMCSGAVAQAMRW
jgi:hypothetical protein